MAAKKGSKDDGLVDVTLAHPLNAEQVARFGVDDGKGREVGDSIKVDQAYARAIINSGYATVDPEDAEAVADNLGISDPTATSGN